MLPTRADMSVVLTIAGRSCNASSSSAARSPADEEREKDKRKKARACGSASAEEGREVLEHDHGAERVGAEGQQGIVGVDLGRQLLRE